MKALFFTNFSLFVPVHNLYVVDRWSNGISIVIGKSLGREIMGHMLIVTYRTPLL